MMRGFLEGDDLLDAVSASMSTLHERYYGRAPASTKSQMMGEDLLACVLGGVYTEVEKTMIELERTAIVQETRSAFQAAMQQKFITEVERLSGRRVLAFISNQHVGPDLEVELFVLAARP
ncbi:MAG: Na-translocating system protein MpsC family protein [Conexibacter sp.]